MPRRPREDFEGALQHVWARGNRRRSIFLDDLDRERYMALLGEAIARFDWICLAFCLMTNHVHLLLETRRGNLGEGMKWLHGEYARAFNDRHDLDGHLFQGRYGSRAIRSDPQLLVTAAYIAMNPVEAGLCRAPESWAWNRCTSSAPDWLDRDRLNAYLAGFAGGNGIEAFDALVR